MENKVLMMSKTQTKEEPWREQGSSFLKQKRGKERSRGEGERERGAS